MTDFWNMIGHLFPKNGAGSAGCPGYDTGQCQGVGAAQCCPFGVGNGAGELDGSGWGAGTDESVGYVDGHGFGCGARANFVDPVTGDGSGVARWEGSGTGECDLSGWFPVE